ncbi:MAG: ABC transporter permease [Acidobacteria bacterium]|nr:ABC transporter permease [Acidobacteriota bacterium]
MSRLTRVWNALHSGQLEQELDDEQLFHLESLTDDLIHRGMSREQAQAEARRRFGNMLRPREQSRDARLHPWLDSLLQDIRFGARMLRAHAVVTIIMVTSLGLAIGVCAAAFSLIDALILRPLPVPGPEQLVYLSYNGPGPGGDHHTGDNLNFSPRTLQQFRKQADDIIQLFGVMYGGPMQTVLFDGESTPQPIRPQWLSPEAFTILDLQPAAGRLTNPEETRPAVLSYSFWQRRFQGSGNAIGQSLTVFVRGAAEGRFRIIGVAPRNFSGLEPGAPADLWLPLASRGGDAWARRDDVDWFHIRGRLEPHISPEQVEQKLQPLFRQLRGERIPELRAHNLPSPSIEAFRTAQLHLRPASETPSLLRAQFERPLRILSLIVALVLLIASANVANLFVARSTARAHEMALRLAVGAPRARLVQQILLEGALVAAAACVLGLLLAWITCPIIVRMLSPADFPAYLDVRPGARLLAFLLCTGVLTTILSALVPALRASAVSPMHALQQPRSQPVRRGLLRPLVVLQAGFSFAVVFTAVLLLLSFYNLIRADLGFSKDSVTLLTVGSAHPPREPEAAAIVELLKRLRRQPGIHAASLSMVPLVNPFTPARAFVTGPGIPKDARPVYLGVAPGFLETMRIPLLTGHDFTTDGYLAADARSVIVNQAFVHRYVPSGASPIGYSFRRTNGGAPVEQQIIGVVANGRYHTLREAQEPIVFAAFPRLNQSTIVIRGALTGDDARALLNKELEQTQAGMHITAVTTQAERIDSTVLRERLLALLGGCFALLAIIIAAAGMYGMLSYSFLQRTRDIGIRLALGAHRILLLRLVLADLIPLLAAGLVIGLLCGLLLSRSLSSLLYAVTPSDRWSIAAAAASLLFALLTALIPVSRRILRLHPMDSLRNE